MAWDPVKLLGSSTWMKLKPALGLVSVRGHSWMQISKCWCHIEKKKKQTKNHKPPTLWYLLFSWQNPLLLGFMRNNLPDCDSLVRSWYCRKGRNFESHKLNLSFHFCDSVPNRENWMYPSGRKESKTKSVGRSLKYYGVLMIIKACKYKHEYLTFNYTI